MLVMVARRTPTAAEIADAQRRVQAMIPKLKKLERISPSTIDLIAHWCERLLDGESIEEIQPEMDRLLAMLAKRKK